MTRASKDNAGRPRPLSVVAENIPAELKRLRQWVTWKYELRDKKWTKPPFRLNGVDRASSTDPTTWGGFDETLACYRTDGVDGIGFVVTIEAGILGIDLDHCFNRETRKGEQWAIDIIQRMRSYTEFSPSGEGIRIFVKGTLPSGTRNKNGNIEGYERERYFTVTGHRLRDAPLTIEPRQREIEWFFESFLKEKKNPKRHGKAPRNTTDEELFRKAFAARNGEKLKRLFEGDISDYPSQSEADLALCSMLAFWAADEAQLDRLFRGSALYRDKWDERHGDTTYGERTIQKALERATEHYDSAAGRERGNATATEHFTDRGNARRFAQMHVGSVFYSAERQKWIFWNGRFWQWDITGVVFDFVEETILGIYAEAASAKKSEIREALSAHAVKSESRGKIEAMLALAQGLPEIRTDLIKFDRQIYLFNAANQTIDLTTGRAREFRREDLLTKISPTIYDPQAQCPLFMAFLDFVTLGRKDLAKFIQRAAGYSLTASTKEQCVLILYGSGGNGKSTLVSSLARTLGRDYAQQLKTEILFESKYENKDYYLADLVGVRFAAACEASKRRKLAAALVKQATGGEPLKARRPFEMPIQFEPHFKLWFSTNHKPRIDDTTDAMWRRVYMIPFDAKFTEGKRIKGYEETLLREASGILNWMIEGCLEWQRTELDPPQIVKAMTKEYREEEDLIGSFIADNCVVDLTFWIAAKELYESYVKWCDEHRERIETATTFGTVLTEKGFLPDKKKGIRVRMGLSLK